MIVVKSYCSSKYGILSVVVRTKLFENEFPSFVDVVIIWYVYVVIVMQTNFFIVNHKEGNGKI